MAATVSSGGGGSDELFAEPAEALPLIAQSAAVGTKATTSGVAHAASSLPDATAGAVPATPFDAAVQAALVALAEQDAAASMANATSASTHASGADASVASVVAEEAQSAENLTRVGDKVSGTDMYHGYAATMPPAASVPSTRVAARRAVPLVVPRRWWVR
jgi:hypothetical protein